MPFLQEVIVEAHQEKSSVCFHSFTHLFALYGFRNYIPKNVITEWPSFAGKRT